MYVWHFWKHLTWEEKKRKTRFHFTSILLHFQWNYSGRNKRLPSDVIDSFPRSYIEMKDMDWFRFHLISRGITHFNDGRSDNRIVEDEYLRNRRELYCFHRSHTLLQFRLVDSKMYNLLESLEHNRLMRSVVSCVIGREKKRERRIVLLIGGTANQYH